MTDEGDRQMRSSWEGVGGESGLAVAFVGCDRSLRSAWGRAAVSTTKPHAGPALRRLPRSARSAAAAKFGSGPNERLARDRFSRTFAAVLAERYGGNWTVKWKEETGEDRGSDRA